MSVATDAANNFSFFVGAFGLVSTIISVAIFLRFLLPSSIIKKLDEAYGETSDIYKKSVCDGLLPDNDLRREIEAELATYNDLRTGFRERVFQSLSFCDEVRGLVDGLTSGIRETTFALRQLRCRIVTTTQETRRNLEQQRQQELQCTGSGSCLSRSSTMTLNINDKDCSIAMPSEDDQRLEHCCIVDGGLTNDSSELADLSTNLHSQESHRFCLLCILRLHQHTTSVLLPVTACQDPSPAWSRSNLPGAGRDHICSGNTTQSKSHSDEIGTSNNQASLFHHDARSPSHQQPPLMDGLPLLPPPVLTLSTIRVLEYKSHSKE